MHGWQRSAETGAHKRWWARHDLPVQWETNRACLAVEHRIPHPTGGGRIAPGNVQIVVDRAPDSVVKRVFYLR